MCLCVCVSVPLLVLTRLSCPDTLQTFRAVWVEEHRRMPEKNERTAMMR